jgi:hypothetical protein
VNQEAIDFHVLVEQMRSSQVGKNDLAIWGEACAETEALDLVKHWPTVAQMPYRIWEYCSNIVFGRDISANVQWLERARLFGEGGDLSLRRDAKGFHWWFVGPIGSCLPDGFQGKDFWKAESDAKFHECKEAALLWGKGGMHQAEGEQKRWIWFEDRTASAQLCYPVDGEPERVQVDYRTYSRRGRIEFVWLTGLSSWEGPQNG